MFTCLLFAIVWIAAGRSDAATAPDREDDVDPARVDVYVSVGGLLENPIGFCNVEPCAPGETSPNDPSTCNVCHSSFGRDAMRQAVIVQKTP